MFVYSSSTTKSKAKDVSRHKLKKVTKNAPKVSSFVGPAVEEPKRGKKTPSFVDQQAATSTKSETNSKKLKPKKPLNHFRIILMVIAIGALGFMYLAHVKATTALFEKRNQVRLDYERAIHRIEELERKYERTISPSEVYENAAKDGFIHSGANDKVIYVTKQ